MADLVIPALGESITEAVIAKWLVAVGDYVKQDQPVLDLETDKITVQLPSPVSGALKEKRFEEGATVKVGDVVGAVDGSASAGTGENGKNKPSKARVARASELPTQVMNEAPPVKQAAPPPPARASSPMLTEVLAPERDSSGRVLPPSKRRQALDGAVEAKSEQKAKPAAPVAARPAAPVVTGAREEAVKMSPLRKRIAERLVEVQQSAASLTTFNEVDMTRLMALRDKHKDDFLKAHGVKLGFMSFFVKASVAALKLYPGLNAEVRGDSIVYKKFYDIGIAVGTDKGLVVPVLRNCDELSFDGVERGILELADKAKTGKLGLDDLTGGSFTITNGGIYGSMMSTPILNFPQTGILGMHNIVKRPVAIGDAVEVRPIMYLAVTYDHRVVDGKEAVQFLVAIKQRIEDPERLLFNL